MGPCQSIRKSSSAIQKVTFIPYQPNKMSQSSMPFSLLQEGSAQKSTSEQFSIQNSAQNSQDSAASSNQKLVDELAQNLASSNHVNEKIQNFSYFIELKKELKDTINSLNRRLEVYENLGFEVRQSKEKNDGNDGNFGINSDHKKQSKEKNVGNDGNFDINTVHKKQNVTNVTKNVTTVVNSKQHPKTTHEKEKEMGVIEKDEEIVHFN